MSERNDGGPTFPRIDVIERAENGNSYIHSTNGMSLRDYFAGQALAGLLASTRDYLPISGFAKVSYAYADAMIARRCEPSETPEPEEAA
jgi:hypothetical protein